MKGSHIAQIQVDHKTGPQLKKYMWANLVRTAKKSEDFKREEDGKRITVQTPNMRDHIKRSGNV